MSPNLPVWSLFCCTADNGLFSCDSSLAFLAERSGVWLLDEGELETADTFCVRFLFCRMTLLEL